MIISTKRDYHFSGKKTWGNMICYVLPFIHCERFAKLNQTRIRFHCFVPSWKWYFKTRSNSQYWKSLFRCWGKLSFTCWFLRKLSSQRLHLFCWKKSFAKCWIQLFASPGSKRSGFATCCKRDSIGQSEVLREVIEHQSPQLQSLTQKAPNSNKLHTSNILSNNEARWESLFCQKHFFSRKILKFQLTKKSCEIRNIHDCIFFISWSFGIIYINTQKKLKKQ